MSGDPNANKSGDPNANKSGDPNANNPPGGVPKQQFRPDFNLLKIMKSLKKF